MKKQKKSLGMFTLSMISVAAVLSVRNYPGMATGGRRLCLGQGGIRD